MLRPQRSTLAKWVRYKSDYLNPTIKQQLSHPAEIGSIIEARGFVKSTRASKKVGFVDISDGSNHQTLNIVLQGPDQPKFKVGQSIAVKGQWCEGKGRQPYELKYDPQNPGHSIAIVGDVTEDYPLQKKATSMPFLRTFPEIKHRTSTLGSFLRLRSHVEFKLMEFFQLQDFIKVTPPLITSSDCEGAGEVFSVRAPSDKPGESFFGKNAYLTVSTQLHLECLALALNRAWTLTPCFRAEQSHTTRHLSEFWMLEAELSHVDSVYQVTNFIEDMVRYVTQSLADSSKTNQSVDAGDGNDYVNGTYIEKELVEARWSKMLTPERWPRMTYTDAVAHLNKVLPQDEQLQWGDSLQLKHEIMLAESSPIFITDYPEAQKPFYMLKSANYDPEKPTVACFDLLVPGSGELAGGSLREHDYEVLKKNLESHSMDMQDMDWYLNLRRQGTLPHGGFGLGFERMVTYLAGHDNVRDVAAFPRAPGLCHC
ncbi:Asparagine--tRNA ligase, mitochondrial [Candida viswanathii]|uniref:asparagine--tRNA ligase n=1 Tax=Candida viswanathii TaxID=5486 RepID=A0A367YK78_9ASCO|nr:Asparagine--tRNA ligase, mitochondrial [Candida viswanathii]